MNAQQFARYWNTKTRLEGPSLKSEFRRIGSLAHQLANRLLTQEIYSKPEDVSPSGRPKWRRTHFLAVSEKPAQFIEHGDGIDCRLENTAEYAEPRHEANKPGRRRINLYRTAHWHDDMVQIMVAEIPVRLGRLIVQFLREGSQ
jgi:hypothetical protein